MKKILLIFAMILMSASLMAQKTQYYDLIIQKTTPLLHLYGAGGVINWNNGDLLLTHTTNTLTLTGGDFLLSTTYSLGIGATTPLHKLVVVNARANNLNAFNFTNSDANKNRSTTTQARDTSSLNLWYSYTGSPLLTMTDHDGLVLFRADSLGFGVGTGTPMTRLSVLSNRASNLNAFNFVESDINKNRTTFAQAADSSSLNLAFSYTGSPALNLNSKTGTSIIKIDSSAVTVNVPAVMYVGDTTVTKKYGAVVFKTADSTLYVCRFIRPTGKKCWFPLN